MNEKIVEDGEGMSAGGNSVGMGTEIVTGDTTGDDATNHILDKDNFEIPVRLGGMSHRFQFVYPSNKKKHNK